MTLLSAPEFARLVRKHPQFIRLMASQRRIPGAYKALGKWYIPADAHITRVRLGRPRG